jgi:hypothetical protein
MMIMMMMMTMIIIIIIIIIMCDENLIPKEQKGCYRGSKGYKDQRLISKAILQECKRRKKKK